MAQNHVFRWHDHHRTFLLCFDGLFHHYVCAKEWPHSDRLLNGTGIAAVCEVGAFINNHWSCKRNKRLVFGHTSASCGMVLADTASQEDRRVSNVPDRIHVSLAFSIYSKRNLTSVQCMDRERPRFILSGRINPYHGQHVGHHPGMAHHVGTESCDWSDLLTSLASLR